MIFNIMYEFIIKPNPMVYIVNMNIVMHCIQDKIDIIQSNQ